MIERGKINRRHAIQQIGSVAALATLPVYGGASYAEAASEDIIPVHEPESWASIEAVEFQEGTFVSITDIMNLSIPDPNPVEVLGTDSGLIMSKRFHRFWLYKDGILLGTGPVGFGRVSKDYDTPEGLMTIYRKEGANYSSGEFPARDPSEPNMAFATFFNTRGIAFHGSLNFREFGNEETGVEEYLRVDNSHGCANARRDDAELVHQTLAIGDKVAVLP